MTTSTYLFDISRFACGCAYQTFGHVTVVCPTHRQILVATERLTSPTNEMPEVPGLVMNRYFSNRPEILENSSRNSLHTVVCVRAPGNDDWSDDEPDQVGLCPACYIEDDAFNETHITQCECGNPDCAYRWCGRTSGLHAFWRLHAQGSAEERTGISDRDIFSHGPARELAPEEAAVLDQERPQLDRTANLLFQNMEQLRSSDNPGTAESSPYLCPWLDRDYEDLHAADTPDHIRGLIRDSLKRKLLRLHILGFLSAAAEAVPENQLPLPTL